MSTWPSTSTACRSRGAGMPTSMACTATPIVIVTIVSRLDTFCKFFRTQNRRSRPHKDGYFRRSEPGQLRPNQRQRQSDDPHCPPRNPQRLTEPPENAGKEEAAEEPENSEGSRHI